MFLEQGGTIINGGDLSTAALITGGIYATYAAPATIINFGTIAQPNDGVTGVFLGDGGRVINGSSTDHAALISTTIRLMPKPSTVVNFGTTDTVELRNAHDRFIAESGSSVQGTAIVYYGGGTLEIASGVDTITGMGSTSVDYVGPRSTITGDMSMHSRNFATYVVEAGASLTLTGGNTLSSGDAFIDKGALSLAAGADLTLGDGARVELTGAVANAGTLALDSSGSDTELVIGGGGARVSGGGTIEMSGSKARIVGASAATLLTNLDDTLSGSGVIEGLSLINKGVIDGDTSGRLSVETGANTLRNTGLIENTGAGVTVIIGAIANTGTLQVIGAGVLTLEGAVTGGRVARIDGGTLHIFQAFGESVSFLGAAGVLKLGDSQGFTGLISGFSTTGGTALDLSDIGFTSGATTASFSGTTAGGALTVTDGTHTARIELAGDYLGSTFTVSSDGHGGTTVVDPASASSPAAAPIVQAMAPFQAGPPPHWVGTPAYEIPRHPMLLTPR